MFTFSLENKWRETIEVSCIFVYYEFKGKQLKIDPRNCFSRRNRVCFLYKNSHDKMMFSKTSAFIKTVYFISLEMSLFCAGGSEYGAGGLRLNVLTIWNKRNRINKIGKRVLFNRIWDTYLFNYVHQFCWSWLISYKRVKYSVQHQMKISLTRIFKV